MEKSWGEIAQANPSRQKKLGRNRLNNLSDDPTMYEAFYANQQSKSQEITEMVKEQVSVLIAQLEALPLTEGSTEDILRKLKDNMS